MPYLRFNLEVISQVFNHLFSRRTFVDSYHALNNSRCNLEAAHH